jgi:hypothetical protein
MRRGCRCCLVSWYCGCNSKEATRDPHATRIRWGLGARECGWLSSLPFAHFKCSVSTRNCCDSRPVSFFFPESGSLVPTISDWRCSALDIAQPADLPRTCEAEVLHISPPRTTPRHQSLFGTAKTSPTIPRTSLSSSPVSEKTSPNLTTTSARRPRGCWSAPLFACRILLETSGETRKVHAQFQASGRKVHPGRIMDGNCRKQTVCMFQLKPNSHGDVGVEPGSIGSRRLSEWSAKPTRTGAARPMSV